MKNLSSRQRSETRRNSYSIRGFTGDEVGTAESKHGSCCENQEPQELDREVGGNRHDALEHRPASVPR